MSERPEASMHAIPLNKGNDTTRPTPDRLKTYCNTIHGAFKDVQEIFIRDNGQDVYHEAASRLLNGIMVVDGQEIDMIRAAYLWYIGSLLRLDQETDKDDEFLAAIPRLARDAIFAVLICTPQALMDGTIPNASSDLIPFREIAIALVNQEQIRQHKSYSR